MQQRESGHGTTIWRFRRWDAEQTAWVARKSGIAAPLAGDFARLGVRPYDVSEHHGNLITTAGWARTGNLMTNQGATQAFDATHTRIGAGNGTGTVTHADADLFAAAGTTNRFWEVVSAAGAVGTRELSFAATFPGTDGNFTWSEAGIDVGLTAGSAVVAALLFNHALISQGPKLTGMTWAVSAVVAWGP